MKTEAKSGHRNGILVVGILILALFYVFWKGLSLKPNDMKSPLIGQGAQDFQVKLVQGGESLKSGLNEHVSLADLKGHPVILNFWASWCGTCAEESRVYETFWKQHSQDGVKVLAIAVHDRQEDLLQVVRSSGKSYPIAIDEEGRTALNYGVTGVPESVFIDANGRIVHKETGPVSLGLLEAMLVKIKGSAT